MERPANDTTNIKNQRLTDPSTMHLNVNSFRNKYEIFAELMENFNKFLNSESKFDVTSPNIQFHLNRFKTFRCDLNRYRGD